MQRHERPLSEKRAQLREFIHQRSFLLLAPHSHLRSSSSSSSSSSLACLSHRDGLVASVEGGGAEATSIEDERKSERKESRKVLVRSWTGEL